MNLAQSPSVLNNEKQPGIDSDDVTRVSDSAYLFFKAWLLDRKPEIAMGFLRQQRLSFCSNLKDEKERTSLDLRNRMLFREMLTVANKNLKRPSDLASAIRAVVPIDPAFKSRDHKWNSAFTVAAISDGDYDHHFLCTSKASGLSDTSEKNARMIAYGNHFVVKFQFLLPDGNGGILRLLWTEENGKWKIEAFDAVTG